MKTKMFLKAMAVAVIALYSLAIQSCTTSVNISSSEQDAKIYVDGNYAADGFYRLTLQEKECRTVRIEKPGYLPEEIKYCYEVNGYPYPPSHGYFTLDKDESYDASMTTDWANVDFDVEVNEKYSEDQAWKIISQIIGNYFDEIVNSSKETGYLQTAWEVKSFKQRTIRTRVIVKNSSSSPLKYKIKVISEVAYDNNVSVKNDELFKEWDRVLKKYQPIIGEFQTRLGNK